MPKNALILEWNKLRLFLFMIVCAHFVACGEISLGTPEDTSEPDFSLADTLDSYAFAFSTDYASSGQIYFSSLDNETTALNLLDIPELGSSGVIHLVDDLLYVLHDGFSIISSDNLQIIDPNDGYTTSAQWSTGNGTNPTDLAIKGHKAFISLYSPELDETKINEIDEPCDVIEIDILDGSMTHCYAFLSYLNNDANKAAHASFLMLNPHNEDELFVLLQDLNPDTFEADTFGKLAIINTQTHLIENVITLEGFNPTSLAVSADASYLMISHMASYNPATQRFDTDTDTGGIEWIDLATLETVLFAHDEDLTGYVERLVVSDNFVYAHVSNDNDGVFQSKIIRLAQTPTLTLEATTFVNNGDDIRAITFHNQHLWVSSFDVSEQTAYLNVYNETSVQKVGSTLVPVATAMSLTSNNNP